MTKWIDIRGTLLNPINIDKIEVVETDDPDVQVIRFYRIVRSDSGSSHPNEMLIHEETIHSDEDIDSVLQNIKNALECKPIIPGQRGFHVA